MKRWGWLVLVWVFTALITLILGFAGLISDHSPAEAGYLTLQMFFLNSDTSDFKNLLTWVAAFCGAVSSLVGLVGIFVHAFWEQIKLLRIYFFWKEHVILVGLGDKAMVLACKMLVQMRDSKGKPIRMVAIDPDRSLEHADDFTAMGGLVLNGSGTDASVWSRLKADRSRCVCILTGNDQTNADVEAALNEATRNRVPVYTCYDDPLLAIALGESHVHHQDLSPVNKMILEHSGPDGTEILRAARTAASVPGTTSKTFGDSVNVPLKAYEKFWRGRMDGPSLLAGDGPLLEAAVIEWANARVRLDDANIRLDVIGPNAQSIVQRLTEWHGACSCVRNSISGADRLMEGEDSYFDGDNAPRYIHVTSGEEAWNLRSAVMILNSSSELAGAQTTCAVVKSSGLSTLVGGEQRRGYVRGISSVNIYELAAEMMGEQRTELDRIVESCYMAYMEAIGQPGADPAAIPLKDKNLTLAQALFFIEALERRKFNLTRIAGASAELSDEDIEFLTEREHERWRFEKLAQDFRYAPTRGEKLRPMLVPWSAKWAIPKDPSVGDFQDESTEYAFTLAREAMKQHDLTQIRGMLNNLKKQGVRLVRL